MQCIGRLLVITAAILAATQPHARRSRRAIGGGSGRAGSNSIGHGRCQHLCGDFGVVEKAEADLVVGSHRPAMKDYLLGTNAARVVRHAGRSVLVARN